MQERIAIWGTILRISLQERLVYRGDFMLGTLMRFLPIVTQIFLWLAVFQATGGTGSTIAGYSFHQFVAYYLLTMISRAFSSMPGLSSGLAEQIRDGDIKKYLVQPVDPLEFLLIGRVAHKIAYYVVALIPFILVFWWCREYFEGWPSAMTMLAFLATLVMSFLLGFFMEACLGLMGFWFGEVSSLVFVYMLVNFFLSGHMFPIDMLEKLGPIFGLGITWADVVRALPFQYLAYFPAAVFLGKLQGWPLAIGLLMQLGWTVAFIALARAMWYYGARQYSAYGG